MTVQGLGLGSCAGGFKKPGTVWPGSGTGAKHTTNFKIPKRPAPLPKGALNPKPQEALTLLKRQGSRARGAIQRWIEFDGLAK